MPPAAFPKCFTATNTAHVLAGRAYDWFFLARVKGSNAYMGLDNMFAVTTLRQTRPDFYVIGTCA